MIGIGRISSYSKELDEIGKLDVDITAHRHRALHQLYVPLLHQNRSRLIAKPFHLRLRQQLALHQMLDLTVQTRTRRHRFQSLSLSLNAQIRTTEIADFMNRKPYKNSNRELTDLCEESPKPIYKVLRLPRSSSLDFSDCQLTLPGRSTTVVQAATSLTLPSRSTTVVQVAT
ncbi:hypothetical protein FCV25MIE_04267 [Fagus crenata]